MNKKIAEALYNAGYRQIDENCAVITKAELKEYKRQAVKEFAEKLKIKAIKLTAIESYHICEFVDELLKEYDK